MNCPNCHVDQKITESNYGALYTCASCQAVYFINFNGQPEFGEASSEEYEAAQAANESQVPDGFDAGVVANPLEMPTPLTEMGSLEPQLAVNEVLEPQTQIDSFISEFNSMNSSPTEANTENPFELQNNLNALNSDVREEVPVVKPVPVPIARVQEKAPIDIPAAKVKSVGIKPDFTAKPQTTSVNVFADIAQEISDFANTDSQLAGLNYDVVISGIDTQDTKMLFKEAIEDSKFAWDSFEIMKSIKNGRLELHRLSPAKAFLLAKRIQFLDIEKTWKQNVLV